MQFYYLIIREILNNLILKINMNSYYFLVIIFTKRL